MNKRKKKKKNEKSHLVVFAPWRHDSNFKPPKGQKLKSFVAMPHSLLMHENFIRLKPTSKVIYIYMTDFANGKEITTFPKRIYETITTKQTFNSAKEDLINHGFIEVEECGKFTRTENVYKFSDKWKTTKFQSKPKRKTPFNK